MSFYEFGSSVLCYCELSRGHSLLCVCFHCSPDAISVISLDKAMNITSIFTVNCTTSGSPATSVTWRRNDTVLTTGSTYQTTQILLDRSTATYANLLRVNVGPYGIPADYTCVASNLLGLATKTTRFTG